MLNFDALRLLFACGLVVGIALSAVLTHWTRTSDVCPTGSVRSSWTVDETACPPLAECQGGVVKTVDDLSVCSAFDQPVGTACTSQCYATGTTTTCDDDHQCSSTNASACLGYCEITDPYGTYELEHPACEGKLAFKPYFIWGTANSSNSAVNQLYFSDWPADCWPEYGCRWYATAVRAYSIQNSPDYGNWFSTTGAIYDCLDFLAVDNPECIQTIVVQMSSNMSDAFMRNKLNGHTSLNLTKIHFETTICQYAYRCAGVNQTYYTDPAYLWGGKKRDVSEPPTVVLPSPHDMAVKKFMSYVETNAREIGRKLDESFSYQST